VCDLVPDVRSTNRYYHSDTYSDTDANAHTHADSYANTDADANPVPHI
jgi:hypothetical protein